MSDHSDKLAQWSTGSGSCIIDKQADFAPALPIPTKQAFKEQWFVYSPSSEESTTQKILQQMGIHCTLNDYSVSDWRGKKVFFYGLTRLNELQKSLLKTAAKRGAQVKPLLTFVEERLQQVPVEFLDAESLMSMDVPVLQYQSTEAKVQRVLDIVLASVLLLISFPLLLLVALAIKLDSLGPTLFFQSRTGLFNRSFTVIKFRSMYVDAEKDGARWASTTDHRITRVGRWMRRLRIDEFPQLINVITGDMSMIGPRPEREVFICGLEKQIPYYRFRHLVKPGITGLAQVMYHYGASVEDARNKHRYDLYYIKHRGLLLNARILFYTVRTVLGARGV